MDKSVNSKHSTANTSTNESRRGFLKLSLGLVPTLFLLKPQNLFATDVLVKDGEIFQYKSKGPPDKPCKLCNHYDPNKKGEKTVGSCKAAECRLIPGKYVCADGWCQVWMKKA